MKRFFIALLISLSSTSCATQNLKQDLTTQTLSNNSLQFYTALTQSFFTALEGSTDCASAEAALQSLVGTENCTNGGTVETSFLNFSCEKNFGLQANATFEQDFIACQEPGENLQGVIDISLSWNGVQLDSTLSSAAFFYNGLPQSFNPLHIDIEEGEAQCSGVLITQGQVCNVTPNCQFCPL